MSLAVIIRLRDVAAKLHSQSHQEMRETLERREMLAIKA
jgi:hypothetical protein